MAGSSLGLSSSPRDRSGLKTEPGRAALDEAQKHRSRQSPGGTVTYCQGRRGGNGRGDGGGGPQGGQRTRGSVPAAQQA